MPNFRLLLLLLLYACSSYADSHKQDRINIGVILPLSGDSANWTEGIKNGIELAREELSAADKVKYNFIFEDDSLSAPKAVSAFRKITAGNNLDVVINFSSGTANALAPLTEEKGIVLLAVASDVKVVASRKYAFNFWVTPEVEAEVAAKEAIRLGYKKIARIATIHDGVQLITRTFDRFGGSNYEIVFSQEFPPEVKDFRSTVARVHALKDIDAVNMIVFPGQAALLAMQLRQGGVTAPLFSWEVFDDQNEVANAKGALNGAWYVSAASLSDEFTKRYSDKFPNMNLYGAGNGYDMVKLIVAANGHSEEIREYLANLRNYKGALGTYSASGDNRFALPAEVKVISSKG